MALLLLAGAALGRAQERPQDREAHDADRGPTPLRLELPAYGWGPPDDLLEQVTLRRAPPGSLIVRYEGWERFLVREAQRQLRRTWEDSLDDLLAAGRIDERELGARGRALADAHADLRAGGRWWERTWLEARSPERGGAPASPVEQVVGEDIDLLRLGPIRLRNDLRFRLDWVATLVQPDVVLRRGSQLRASDVALLTRDPIEPGEPWSPGDPWSPGLPRELEDRGPRLGVVLAPERSGWSRYRPTVGASVSFSSHAPLLVRSATLRASVSLGRGLALQATARQAIDAPETTFDVELTWWGPAPRAHYARALRASPGTARPAPRARAPIASP